MDIAITALVAVLAILLTATAFCLFLQALIIQDIIDALTVNGKSSIHKKEQD